MLILVYTLNAIIFMLVKLLYEDLHNSQLSKGSSTKEDVTIENLIPISLLESWMENSTSENIGKVLLSENVLENSKEYTVEDCLGSNGSCIDKSLKTFVNNVNKSSELEPSFEKYVEALFNPPSELVKPDWEAILGSFSFYEEENWRNFLIEAECPVLIRMIIENISETLSFSRKYKKNTKDRKKIEPESKEKSPLDYKMLYRTTVWFISHDITFRLNEKYTEYDFVDGDTSENLFFFLAPRILVQNKYKLNHRVAMIFHFDESHLNITFFDRDVAVMARRFYKRID